MALPARGVVWMPRKDPHRFVAKKLDALELGGVGVSFPLMIAHGQGRYTRRKPVRHEERHAQEWRPHRPTRALITADSVRCWPPKKRPQRLAHDSAQSEKANIANELGWKQRETFETGLRKMG
jgi:hypothetical protein